MRTYAIVEALPYSVSFCLGKALGIIKAIADLGICQNGFDYCRLIYRRNDRNALFYYLLFLYFS